MDSKAPTLGQACKFYTVERMESIILLHLVELNEFLALKNGMTETQMIFIAEEIVTAYRNLTIADVYLIFSNIKRGKYGKMFERLDSVMLLSWFEQYQDERMEEAGRRSIEEAKKYRMDYKDPLHITDEFLKKWHDRENLPNPPIPQQTTNEREALLKKRDEQMEKLKQLYPEIDNEIKAAANR